ncbi:ICOS ligand-like [Cetorhinus maximus]
MVDSPREVISVDKYFQSLPGDSSVPVSGFLGEQVVLPCTYKGNVPVSDLLAVWDTAKSEILHKFIAGNDDLTEQDPRFRNRTNLFKDQLGQGNWSVLISDLKETDQNQYICHIYKRIAAAFVREQTDIIHLSVTERVRTPVPNTPVPSTPVPISGFLGEQVVLPCTYKGNVPVSDLLAVWVTAKSEILHKFIAGNDDLTEQDPRFTNRTNLFKDQLGQGNWSVLIFDLKETDQIQYICHIYKRIAAAFVREQTDIIHLSVTERPQTPVPNTPVPSTPVPNTPGAI